MQFFQLKRTLTTAANNKNLAALFIILVIALLPAISLADDTEIFTGYVPADKNSNVVFVIDTSGSMGHRPANATSGPAKLLIVKNVFEQLLFDLSQPNHSAVNPALKGITMAVMRFDSGSNDNSNGGYFLTKLEKLNNVTTADKIWTEVNKLNHGGSTPLAETLYEAALFYSGQNVHFGGSTSPGTNPPAITADNKYISPIEKIDPNDQCSINNHVVMLTDGLPTVDHEADTMINDNMGGNCSFASGDDCLPDVAKYLADSDFNSTVSGKQNVKTHTIAFDLEEVDAVNLLKETATLGGGLFKSASDGATLAAAIGQVIGEIAKSAKSFVTPVATVSDANRFVHEKDMYFALFDPTLTPKWGGNLKAYQIDMNGDDAGTLKDYSSEDPDAANPAIDMSTGEFFDNAISKWSNGTDGNDVTIGGAADNLTTSRNIRTGNGTTTLTINNVTNADLGVANDNERNAVINWARGVETVDGNVVVRAKALGDPLHSQPVMVNYGGDTGKVIFFATNEGYFHAIKASNGAELMAYIPSALLPNLKVFMENSGTDHPYGLDGQITVYESETQKIAIVGMRRGGDDYYALDVTDVSNPELLWTIDGGQGDFANLGQTWSKAFVTKLRTGNTNSPTVTDVVMFTGGYHTQYDPVEGDPVELVTPSVGSSIFAVNLLTGSLVWQATNGEAEPTVSRLEIPQMIHSMPADPTIIDYELDGIADKMYAIDVTGNIFRIDFNATVTSGSGTSTATQYIPDGKLFANISGGNRKFYNAVDAMLGGSGVQLFAAISVGSGYRANPLNPDITDRFYSIKDVQFMANSLPDDFTPITNVDLHNATLDTTVPTDKKGWYFDLPGTGEKALAEAATMNYKIYFTTYTPPTQDEQNLDPCAPALGRGKLYVVNAFNSEGAIDNQRAVLLDMPGIPSSVKFMVSHDLTPGDTNLNQSKSYTATPCVGLECKMTGTEPITMTKEYWK